MRIFSCNGSAVATGVPRDTTGVLVPDLATALALGVLLLLPLGTATAATTGEGEACAPSEGDSPTSSTGLA